MFLLVGLSLWGAPAFARTPPPEAPAPAAAPAEPALDPSFDADIRSLIEVSGGAALGRQMFEGMMASMKGGMPNVPPTFWDAATKEFDPNEFTDMLVPIYARYYTQDDIRQLIAFYQSPLGRKMVATNPMVVQDSMAAGQAWGQRLAERVIKKLQESGQLPN